MHTLEEILTVALIGALAALGAVALFAIGYYLDGLVTP